MCQLEVPVATTIEALKLGKKHEGIFFLAKCTVHVQIFEGHEFHEFCGRQCCYEFYSYITSSTLNIRILPLINTKTWVEHS